MSKGISNRGAWFLLAGAVMVLAILIGLMCWGASTVVHQWTEVRIQSWLKESHLQSQVTYRTADHDLFSGATILRGVELRFDPAAAPLILSEVRINRFDERSSVPTAIDVYLNNVVFTPACLTYADLKNALLQAGFERLSGSAHLSCSLDSNRKEFNLSELRLKSGNQFDFQVSFQAEGVDFKSWKSFVQEVQREPFNASAQTMLGSARLISASGSMIYGNAIDYLADLVTKFSFGLSGNRAVVKEQWVQSATQQIPPNHPGLREAVALMIRTPCRVSWASHPQKPIPFNETLSPETDWIEHFNLSLEATPINAPGND